MARRGRGRRRRRRLIAESQADGETGRRGDWGKETASSNVSPSPSLSLSPSSYDSATETLAVILAARWNASRRLRAVNLRTKLVLVFVALALVPLAVVSVVSYRSGVAAVEGLVRASADESAARIRRRVEHVLAAQESRLLELAKSDSLRGYARDARAAQPGIAPAAAGGGAGVPDVPDTVGAHFGAYFKNNRDYLEAVTCLDPSGRPLFRATWEGDAGGDVVFQTTNFVSGEARYDTRVWSLAGAEALRSPVTEEAYGAALRVTLPVVDSTAAASGAPPAAARGAEVRLGDLFKDADERDAQVAPAAAGGDAATRPARP